MLNALRKDGVKQNMLILCACDMVECALPVFEKKYPEDNRPKKAIEAARNYLTNPTAENRSAAAKAAVAARIVAYPVFTNAAHAACAAANVAYAAYTITTDSDYLVNAASFASFALTNKNECKELAEIIRKYFPIAPIL